jgi:hypothetical protein
MPIIVLSNPRSFARECEAKNITLDLLNEAKMCIGAQTVCKMFIGKSTRGDESHISASSLETWIETLNFVKNNPDKEDGGRFSGARMLEKYGDAWDKYVAFVKTPIPDETVNSWEKLPNSKLGDAASAVGITMGIRNFESLKLLRTRLYDMVKRRKELFWDRDLSSGFTSDPKGSKGGDEPDQKGACEPTVIAKVDYKFNNTLTLHKMCKHRGIVSAKLTKDEMITLLVDYDIHKGSDGSNIPVPAGVYEKMKKADLNNICKEKKPALITALGGSENTSINNTQDTVSLMCNAAKDLKYQNELLIQENLRLKEIIKSYGLSI